MHDSKKQKINVRKSKFMESVGQYEAEIMNDIIRLLDNLYDMRLVQKISRPIDISSKEKLASKFNDKVIEMNDKLRKVLKLLSQKTTYEENIKEKSLYQEITSKNNELRKKIRIIETRYNQVLIEGSFKHYRKIKNMFGIRVEIQMINIEDWSVTCLDKTNGHSQNCC